MQKGKKFQLENPNGVLQPENLKICETHKYFYKGSCVFCVPSKEPEEFYCKVNLEKPLNIFILDVKENRCDDRELFNAGISSYDQFIHQKEIQQLKKQGINPKDIAIKLGLYTQSDIDDLILEAVNQVQNKTGQFSVTIDAWRKSKTTTFLERVVQILEDLNLRNSIIIYPSTKANVIKLVGKEWSNSQRFMASEETINKLVAELKADSLQFDKKKKSLPNYEAAQIKRLLNSCLKYIQSVPFSGEMTLFTDDQQELQNYAQKYGKQNSKFNIYCNPNYIGQYYNIGGLTGSLIQEHASQEKRQTKLRIKAQITTNYIFTETSLNEFEKTYTEIDFPIELEYQLKDPNDHNTTGCLQVIYQDENGCYVQQIAIISHDENNMHEPSSSEDETVKLTELSKD